MKNIKSIQLLLVSAYLLMIVFGSCKKENNDTTPAAAPGTLMFHLHTNADTNEVDAYGDTLVMTGGRRIIVTKAQLYISSIQLVKTDASVIDGPSLNVLMLRENEQYTLGTVASGNYQSVKFNVGLSAATNASTPSASDQTLHRPDMWFDSANVQPNGFVFVNFQGSIDTSTSMSGMFAPFSYKIGTNWHLLNVSMPNQNFTVVPNQAVEVHMIVDYSKLFTGVQLNVMGNLQINTTTDNGGALGTQVANNIPAMFRYE